MAYELCDLSDINDFLGYTAGTNTSRDTTLSNLIPRATDAIERYCERKFKRRTYRLERYSGDGSEWLFLTNYPVYSIDRVSLGSRKAFDVQCSVTAATHANIEIDSDGVSITQIGGTNAGTSDILFTTYATVSAVVAQINSYDDWSAETASGMGGYASSDLFDIWGRYCLDQSLNVYTCDTPIYDFKVYREGGLQTGILQRNAGWTAGNMNISISYNAGYDSVPGDVKQACIETVASFYNRRTKDMNLSGETLGDYEWQRGDNMGYALPQHIRDMLGPRRKFFVIG